MGCCTSNAGAVREPQGRPTPEGGTAPFSLPHAARTSLNVAAGAGATLSTLAADATGDTAVDWNQCGGVVCCVVSCPTTHATSAPDDARLVVTDFAAPHATVLAVHAPPSDECDGEGDASGASHVAEVALHAACAVARLVLVLVTDLAAAADLVARARSHRRAGCPIVVCHAWAQPRAIADDAVRRVQSTPGFGAGLVATNASAAGVCLESTPDANELHVFGPPPCAPEHTVGWAAVRGRITSELPYADQHLGPRLADAMTRAVDELDGTGERVSYDSAHGMFHVAAAAAVAQPTLGRVRNVEWRCVVERCWAPPRDAEVPDPPAGPQLDAYVVEFAMAGLDDDGERRAVLDQLAWGAGVALDAEGLAGEATVRLHVNGPDRQQLRARTTLEAFHVGEDGAPLQVRAMPSPSSGADTAAGTSLWLLRVQFFPGCVDAAAAVGAAG